MLRPDEGVVASDGTWRGNVYVMPRAKTYRPDVVPSRHSFAVAGTRRGVPGRFVPLVPPSPQTVERLKPLPVKDDGWQRECYLYALAVPEVRYVINAKAELLKRCRIVPQVRVAGTDDWTETNDPRVLKILRGFVDRHGSQGNLLKMASVHAEVAGSGWLYGDPDVFLNPNGSMRHYAWAFYSNSEFKVERKGHARVMSWGGSTGDDKAAPNGVAYRFLPSPSWEFSERPMSPVFSVLPLLKELVSASQLVDVLLTSHQAAGLFFLPDEVSLGFGSMDESDDPGNPVKGMDEFQEEIHYYMGQVQSDPSSPERTSPLLVNGPALIKAGDKAWPTKDLMGPIDWSRDFDQFLQPERQELIVRIARGLDIQPEVLTGYSDANHWSGFISDEAFIRQNVVPVGDTILEFVTQTYLRPFLMAFAGMSRDETEWFRFALDPAPILVKSDKTPNANMAHDKHLVTDSAYVEYLGLDSGAMPSPEEQARQVMLDLVLARPEVAPQVLPWLYPDIVWGDTFDGWETSTVGVSDAGKVGEDVPTPARNTPGKPPAPQGMFGSSPVGLRLMVTAAADQAIGQALTTAANRLVGTVARSDTEQADSLRAADPAQVLTIAGEATAQRHGLTREVLFAGCFDDLEAKVTEWLAVDATRRGCEHFEARARAKAAAGELVSQLALLAAGTLARPLRVGPNGMTVPDELVGSAFAAADLVDITSPRL